MITPLLRALPHCLALAAVVACAAHPEAPAPLDTQPGEPQPDLAGWQVAGLEDGLRVAWRTAGGELLRNQDQNLSVLVFFDGAALPGAELTLRGWMPDHGHGFVQAPRVVEEGAGAYRVEGLRLHMRGLWQLFFDVHREAVRETVQFDLEVG